MADKLITVGEMKKLLEQFPDDWFFTIELPTNFVHVVQVYGFDEGEVGLRLDQTD